MKTTTRQTSLVTLACCAVGAAATLLMAGQTHAQTIYRLVGADGKVTFSDKAPTAADKTTATVSAARSMEGAAAALPFELRQVASKYPVTLYTSNSCAPCGAGRALLASRGIPFAEKTVNTAADAEALQRISGENSLPFLTIGGQQIKGYSDAEWTQFLNAAGYPQTPMLPASYRNPAATPLVDVQKPVTTARPNAAQSPRTPVEPSPPPADNSANPAGIKF